MQARALVARASLFPGFSGKALIAAVEAVKAAGPYEIGEKTASCRRAGSRSIQTGQNFFSTKD